MMVMSSSTFMLTRIICGGLLVVFLTAGCTDRQAEARRVKEEAEAKARAEAARKEMDALPKAFKSPPFFKLNEPEKKSDPAATPKKANP